MLRPYLLASICIYLLLGVTSANGDKSDVFGKSVNSEAALIGMLYDLKQTPDHRPTGVYANGYSVVMEEFFNKGWDEALLNRFYRVSRPLYTTQIFIPFMSADEAPKAFGAEKRVAPSRWVIHYKGQVSPPGPGTYRFVGAADDLLAVAVNGKTVLVANRWDTFMPNLNWKPSGPDGAPAADDPLRNGDWMPLKAGQIIDLDIIIGERPGGAFNAFLLIEKQGENYARDVEGLPILPIFQVAPYNTPLVNSRHGQPYTPGESNPRGAMEGDGPEFATGYPPWKSYQ